MYSAALASLSRGQLASSASAAQEERGGDGDRHNRPRRTVFQISAVHCERDGSKQFFKLLMAFCSNGPLVDAMIKFTVDEPG